MPRRVFYSFHYQPDNWRASQVRNMGVIEDDRVSSDNDWESIAQSSDNAIQNWIDQQLVGKSCTVVLIGTNTAQRKWINYEIEKSWNNGVGLLGIYIHNLRDRSSLTTYKGANPFDGFTLDNGAIQLSDVVMTYDPPSLNAYGYIKDNLANWIEDAILIRNQR